MRVPAWREFGWTLPLALAYNNASGCGLGLAPLALRQMVNSMTLAASRTWGRQWAAALACCLAWLISGNALHASAPGNAATWAEARQLMNDGNYQEALARLRVLTLDASAEPAEAAQGLREAANCYQQLNETAAIDAFLAEAARLHGERWEVLTAAAETLLALPGHGFEISGTFQRGDHRGGGKLMNAAERDRAQAIRWLTRAVELLERPTAAADRQSPAAAATLSRLAETVLRGREGTAAWRLQELTSLDELPEYDEGWGRGDRTSGAPVDESGAPVLYDCPADWSAARSDGERWRWALAARTRWQPALQAHELLDRVAFLRSQFGVETLADMFGWRMVGTGEDATAELLQLHTLADDETLARLAIGIKRFRLPEEHHPIALLRRVSELDAERGGSWQQALTELAGIFENRRQYPRAAELWRELLAARPDEQSFQQRLDQIVKPWGRLEPSSTQPASRGATLDLRFRNAHGVEFVAREIKVRELLSDVKRTIAAAGDRLDWQQVQIDNLGYRLVLQSEEKYLGAEVARWKLDVEPRPDHFDRRVTVTTPLQKAGAYLVTANVEGGNVQHVVVWVADTAIVKKPLKDAGLYYVADAVSGKPVANCNVEFFGFHVQHLDANRFRVQTKDFAEKTNAQGLVELPADDEHNRFQWLAIAATPQGRLAYLGYSNVWTSPGNAAEFRQVRAFALTDRPVYRPGQTVQYKFWVRTAQYDLPLESRFANQAFQVEIRNPRNEKVYAQSLTADAYGGLAGSWELPPGADLGQYQFFVVNHGGGTFRVEEYKKPEFEVTVAGPEKPVRLGETITAKVAAKYYFGEPVAEGTVRYKVLRTPHASEWFPPMPWDWLYGPGYWWFAESYEWYPGWARWGCRGPHPWWIPRPMAPPELVAEREAALNPDGTLEIAIDTSIAQQLHPNQDHRYQIEVEVVDPSRRVIAASGQAIAAREPFQVKVWTNRGFVRTGETVQVQAAARTPDGKPVRGTGVLRLMRIAYQDQQPVETEAARWDLATDEEGIAELQITAAEAGQYRLAYALTAASPAAAAPPTSPQAPPPITAEGAVVLTIRRPQFTGEEFRFNDLEIVPHRRHYAPGDKVALQISADQAGANVLLFVRCENGVYPRPQIVPLQGKSTVVELPVTAGDAPNFFVEAVTVHRGRVHTAIREIFVPPASRVIDVEVLPSAKAFLPGQQAEVQLKLTDREGRPVIGAVTAAIYDKALDYIAGGAAPPDIREFFWKWRRSHSANTEASLERGEGPVSRPNDPQMASLGIFGETVADVQTETGIAFGAPGGGYGYGGGGPRPMMMRGMAAGGYGEAPMAAMAPMMDEMAAVADGVMAKSAAGGEASAAPEPIVRQQFADTALWVAHLESNSDGIAKLACKMPENLTAWRVRVWSMSHGTRVGEGSAEVVTRKNLLVRLQTPRFVVDRDEVVLSANVHNYLPRGKQATVRLELEGGVLEPLGDASAAAASTSGGGLERTVEIAPDGQVRLDWRVKAVREGEAVVRVVALTDEESDAMQLKLPVLVHGMLKTESFSGVLRPADASGKFALTVPAERRPDQSRLEIRFSPTLAGAMLDAIPYLVEYPYGCTEQTLNRFLPAVLAQRTLQRMGVDLAALRDKRTNLNPQEVGAADERAAQWKAYERNPVFDEAELALIVKANVNRLTEMQLSGGGWGWFSGWGEYPSAHTTAVVMHGLHVAAANDVALVPDMVTRGKEWLLNYQREQLAQLDNWDRERQAARDKDKPSKARADDLDALVAMVLAEYGEFQRSMRDYLYQDRTQLAPYSLATLGLALHLEATVPGNRPERPQAAEMRQMVIRNLSQFVKQDEENQTAWLDLPGGFWWRWYGSEYEAHAYFLKLLVATEPESPVAPRMVKYLLNNRKHATRWNSTRDTALVLESFADYLQATGEARPQLQVEVWVDGARRKQVAITPENLFTFDNVVVLTGDELTTGNHVVEFRKEGDGPLYTNAYLTNFTLEDPIQAAGLEIKVQRKYFKLTPADATAAVAGGRGQAVRQQVAKYERKALADQESVASGDLIEVELTIDSKNDYEYLVFEDPKAAGWEPVEVRSGYDGNALGAYVEYRDQKVALFVRNLARGTHSVAYRLRAEIPGRFSALPTQASAMYAPELKANSTEYKAVVVDQAPAAP